MNTDVLANFKVGKSDISYRYYNIKTTKEMEQYIKETCPEIIYNEQFMDILVSYEFGKLIELKTNLMKLKDTEETAKDVQSSA